ncbi:MAG: hypothetical protein IKP22_00195 [Clostridia bacterium]|nr:hypothetical protein [Clostridia bacterium]
MKKSRQLFRQFDQIEKEFFEIDNAGKSAVVHLLFQSPEAIFDPTCRSKTPVFASDFRETLQSAFEMIPKGLQISLEIAFEDTGDYSGDKMQDIFRKNLLFISKSIVQSIRARNRIALLLFIAGLVFFVGMIMIGHLWETESFWHEVFFYFLDIATTVLFWEAAGIFLVEKKERTAQAREYLERLVNIRFIKADGWEF